MLPRPHALRECGDERRQALGRDEAVLDPADDDLLIEIAAQLEQVVIRVPLIDLDQRTCTRRGSTQCESQRCLRSARGLLALLAPC